jgi:predicted HicB family RNase H-like nuclease
MASGETTVRMPPALHEQLQQRAAEQGVSLNSLIVNLLAGGIGFKLTD